jgi:predicted phage baseplate assembly protein
MQAAMHALGPPSPTKSGQTWLMDYARAATGAVDQTVNSFASRPPTVPNPLDPKFYGTMGWLCIDLQGSLPSRTAKLRLATFNAVAATNATTVSNEIIGVADGTPGQIGQLANGNIQPGTLSLAVQEAPAATNAPLVPWTAVASLDPSGPFDRVFVLDAETGSVTFGDGIHGRIPPLVPQGGSIIALTYVWGGGTAGNVGVGAVTVLNSPAPGIAAAVNYVAATGGSDVETQEQAAARTRKTLSTGSRAVSTDDFAWMATQTPGVQVARAQVVPLRKPVDQNAQMQAVTATGAAEHVPPGPAGLEDADTPGAISVVVVPQQAGPEPTPSPAFLAGVSQYLNPQRLITTEVYVAPPQYLRLYNVKVSVAGRPGYTHAQLKAAVSAQLASYLHILTGGDGSGFPFGSEVHVADLIAQIYRVAGVARVDAVTADFVRTRSLANPRQGSLALAPAASSTTEFGSLTLAPEESVSFDAASFVLSAVG